MTLIRPAVAQDFEITKSSFTSGGEIGKTGGQFDISGTIGVSRRSPMSGGQFTVNGSLWTKTRTPECVEDIPGYNECFDETMGGSDTIKHWTNDLGLPEGREWGQCMNWYENAIPQDGDNACIPEDDCQDYVIYRESDTMLNTLACGQGFVINGSNGSTRLELNESSHILGEAEMTGNPTLHVNDNLLIDGRFVWRSGTIDGVGTTEVTNGMAIVNNSVTLRNGDFRLTGGVGRNAEKLINMSNGATFEIGTDATFEYEGNAAAFLGGNGLVDIRGSFIRTEGENNANIQTPIDNSGLIHNQTGEFYLYDPSTHTGEVRSDPGTLLGLQSDQMFMPSSTLTAESLELGTSNGGMIHGTVDISERIDGVGGTWTFADDANIISYGNDVYVERGRVNFNAPVDQPIGLQSVTITSPGQSSGTIDFDTGQPVNVVDFDMITGSLFGGSPINISGEFNWTRGFFWQGGAITANGPVTFNATSSSRTLSRILNINDQATFRSGFSLSSGGRVNISENAVVNFQFNSGAVSSGVFANNGGAVLRTSGNGEISLTGAVTNDGLFHNQTGSFTIAPHPLSGTATHTGDVASDPGTLLSLGGTQTFTPTSSITAETLEFEAGGTSMIHGMINISERIDGRGGTWTFADDANIISYGNHVYVERGQVNFNAPVDAPIDLETVTITTPGESSGRIDFNTGQPVNVADFHMIRGSLHGSSPINVSGGFNWTIGTISDGGPITVDGQVTFNASSSSRTIRRVLNINDQATFRAGFSMSGPGRVNISEDAVVDYQSNSSGISGGVFANNGGTVLRTSGDGEISISSAIINDGLFHNQTGTLSFATHPLNGGSTYTGDIVSDPGAVLKFAGANHDLQPSSTMTAEALVLWASSSSCHGSVTISDFIECDGCQWTFAPDANIIDYGDDVIVRRGSLHFESPTDREISFDSVTIEDNFNSSSIHFDTGQPVNIAQLGFFDAGSTINGSSPINISEQFTWSNGSVFSGGVITSDGNTAINPTSSSRTLARPFINNGTMTFRGGVGMSSNARIDNTETGFIDFQYDFRTLSSRTLNNAGTIIRSANDGTSRLQNTDVNNSGTIEVQQGTLEITTAIVTQTDGETIINAGTTLDLSTSDPLALQGGVLKGSGNYLGDVDNSSGVVAPGLSIGELMVDGDYDQSGGMLDIEISGSGNDKLSITGTATLGGELVITNIDGFQPMLTDEFVILEAGIVTGEFDTLSIPPVYEVNYNPTNVTISVLAVSPDLNGDGVVNLLDFRLFQQCFAGPNNNVSPNCDRGVNADLDQDGDVDLDDFQAFTNATIP